MSCGHLFHYNCGVRWFTSDIGKQKCYVCKKKDHFLRYIHLKIIAKGLSSNDKLTFKITGQIKEEY